MSQNLDYRRSKQSGNWLRLGGAGALVIGGAAWALARRSRSSSLAGAALAGAGGLLLSTAVNRSRQGPWLESNVAKAVTIARPPQELYGFWKKLEELPRFMRYLKSVRRLDSRRSHWVAAAPFGRSLEWDAEVVEDVENRRLAWRSLPGSALDHRGSVEFIPAPGNRGTEVHVRLEYHCPAGRAGEAVALMLFRHPEQQIREDLRRFKALMETGELPTTEGQPSGRRSVKIRTMEPFDREMFGNRRLNRQRTVA
ncbi:MAG: SRPBCC family protein [Acidobacteria bacterium]|nr:SRPBCC family protein [Acidobacteriota bacterium]